MEKLATLPVVGPFFAWLFRTRLWHVYEHLDERKWTRLTATITFQSFLALFPMLALGAAVGAALLTPEGVERFQRFLSDQVPGLSQQLDVGSLVENAGTVGVVAGALLVVTGVSWVGTLRECLRAVWDLEEDPGNPVLLRVKDLGVLVGLGLVGIVSVGGSAFALTAVHWLTDRLGLAHGGVGSALLTLAAYAAAVVASLLLLWYALAVLPRVQPPRRGLVVAGLMGAVGFELLKLVLGGYLKGVAAKSMYGAFGVPIALLLWISFATRVLLFCAAWTATERPTGEDEPSGGEAAGPPSDGGTSPTGSSPGAVEARNAAGRTSG